MGDPRRQAEGRARLHGERRAAPPVGGKRRVGTLLGRAVHRPCPRRSGCDAGHQLVREQRRRLQAHGGHDGRRAVHAPSQAEGRGPERRKQRAHPPRDSGCRRLCLRRPVRRDLGGHTDDDQRKQLFHHRVGAALRCEHARDRGSPGPSDSGVLGFRRQLPRAVRRDANLRKRPGLRSLPEHGRDRRQQLQQRQLHVSGRRFLVLAV